MKKWPKCLIITIAAFFALPSCSNKPIIASCADLDWYEAGRRDGVNGHSPSKFDDRLSKCSGDVKDQVKVLYMSGRNTGLVSYCTADNGWNVGRAGLTYSNVCPMKLERSFRKNYRLGMRVYSLEKQNYNIGERIANLSSKLQIEKLDVKEKYLLTSQIEELRNNKEDNSKKMSSIQRSLSLQ